ncbi:MAG: PorT family protein [Bacteroidales bacterium]|nr:PorT family protein [Bacteroidales bacterium]
MTKRLTLISALFLITGGIFAQNSYIATDSSSVSGIRLVPGSERDNAQFCKVIRGQNIVKYGPEELTEYGLNNGRVYIAKEILINNSPRLVFLERVARGNTTLYYYRGENIQTYFLEKSGSPLKALDKKAPDGSSFKNELATYTADCDQVKDASKLVSYSKKSMKRFISNYNNCVLKPFPTLRFGATAGIELTQLTPGSQIYEGYYAGMIDYKYDAGGTFGLLVDVPIMASYFSFHTEVLFSKYKCSYYQVISGVDDTELKIDATGLKIPVLLRYTWPNNVLRPFLNAGVFYNFNITNEYTLSEIIKSPGNNETVVLESDGLHSDSYFGFTGGCGVEYAASKFASVFAEARYSYGLGLDTKKTLNKNQIQISLGVLMAISKK